MCVSGTWLPRSPGVLLRVSVCGACVVCVCVHLGGESGGLLGQSAGQGDSPVFEAAIMFLPPQPPNLFQPSGSLH